jgi:adenylate cyclase
MGEQSVKNIARPVRAYAMSPTAIAATPLVPAQTLRRRPSLSRRAGHNGRTQRGVKTKPVPRLSIVVLPFANLSSDPEQEYFVDAITDDLTTDLSRIVNSFVISRTTAFTYKGKAIDVKQIGSDLGVRYVLEGSVRRLGEQVQVNVQLIDAESGSHIWADRFDTDRSNLAKAQGEITSRLARTLQIELVTAASRRIEQDNPANLEACDLVMRGWAVFYRPVSAANLDEAHRFFEQALQLDPGSVDARVGIATVLNERLTLGWSKSREHDTERSDQLLAEALERDRNYSLAHTELGRVRRLQGRLIEARIEFENALALDRNNTRAVHQLGIALIYLGQPEAALPHLDKVLQLDPRYQHAFYRYFWAGYCHLLLHRLDEAIDLLRKGRAAGPQHWFFHLNLAAALALQGNIDEAGVSLAESLRLNSGIASIAKLPDFPGTTKYAALREKTVLAGLRRAGLPEQ